MTTPTTEPTSTNRSLPKAPTGIQGLDELTRGGLPRGRPTLVCGSAGCGKTLLGIEFLVRGATQFDEPGVLMAFEETAEELTQNVRSLGFDLDELVRQKKLALDYVRIERSEIEETGEYDLEGLFVRLGYAIDSIGAKRVVLDTIEALFAGLSNTAILRAELRRLFRWLKKKGVTAIITGGTGRWNADPARPGRIRLRLRDRAGSSHHRADFHPAAADRQVPRLPSRHRRIPFLDRREGHLRPAGHLAGTAARGLQRADLQRRGAAGRDVGRRRLLSRHQRPGLRHGGDRQDQPGRPFRRCGLPPRRTGLVLGLRGIPGPVCPQHAVHRLRPGAARPARAVAVRGVAPDALRAGNAPGHHAQADRRV